MWTPTQWVMCTAVLPVRWRNPQRQLQIVRADLNRVLYTRTTRTQERYSFNSKGRVGATWWECHESGSNKQSFQSLSFSRAFETRRPAGHSLRNVYALCDDGPRWSGSCTGCQVREGLASAQTTWVSRPICYHEHHGQSLMSWNRRRVVPSNHWNPSWDIWYTGRSF